MAVEGSTVYSDEGAKSVRKFFNDVIAEVAGQGNEDAEDPLEPESPV